MQPLNKRDKDDFKAAFKELEDRLHDIKLLANLKKYIEDDMHHSSKLDSVKKQLEKSINDIDSTLIVQAVELRNMGGECNSISEELQQLDKKLKRRIITVDELLKQMKQTEGKLKQLIARTSKKDRQVELVAILRCLEQMRQQLEYDVSSYHMLYNRGRIKIGRFEEFNPVTGADSLSKGSKYFQPGHEVTEPQIGDSRVVRPQNSPKDLEIYKELYERRKQ